MKWGKASEAVLLGQVQLSPLHPYLACSAGARSQGAHVLVGEGEVSAGQIHPLEGEGHAHLAGLASTPARCSRRRTVLQPRNSFSNGGLKHLASEVWAP